MAKDYLVTKRSDGLWQAIGEGNSRVSFVGNTQEQARQRAKEYGHPEPFRGSGPRRQR